METPGGQQLPEVCRLIRKSGFYREAEVTTATAQGDVAHLQPGFWSTASHKFAWVKEKTANFRREDALGSKSGGFADKAKKTALGIVVVFTFIYSLQNHFASGAKISVRAVVYFRKFPLQVLGIVEMIRILTVAAAICFSAIASDAAQLSISGSYEVGGNTNIVGVSPFNVGDTGQWTLDLAWSNTGVSSTTAFDSVSLTMTNFGGQTYEYTVMKSTPVATLSTGAVGNNHFLKFDDFSFGPATSPVGGTIGNADAVLQYQALTDLAVAGTNLTQARVDAILGSAFQSEGSFDIVTTGTAVYVTSFVLNGPTMVPEPGTVGLFGLLASGLGVVAWRRRRSL